MSYKIYTIKLGINRCYLIKGDIGYVMIDGGPPGKIEAIKGFFQKNAINPVDIKLIILTHGDFDHTGSCGKLRDLTGAQIAIHQLDRELLEQGRFNWPDGVTAWGRISRGILAPFIRNMKFPPVKPDIILDSHEFLLNDFGIRGKIIHTPGHTPGHVSVLLESGDAFAGCMAHNNLPFRLSPGLPIYAQDIDQLRKSWKPLIERGAKIIYPGHGDVFPVEKILSQLS